MATSIPSTPSRDFKLRAHYDREARRYDSSRYASAEGKIFTALEAALLEESVDVGPGQVILDMPVGTGRLIPAVAKRDARVVGGDISWEMLGRVADKAAARGTTGVHLVQLNGARLPFPDDTFDAVVSFKFFHLIPNERKPLYLREMVRVLKPGRRLVVEFNSPFYGGVLALWRYYFASKKRRGGMRTKCLFPDQIPSLFRGLKLKRVVGVKMPLAGRLARLIGVRASWMLSRALGRLPILRYLEYAIVVEVEKPA